MNKQFQEDIKLAHSVKKLVKNHLAKGDISIVWLDLNDSLRSIIWVRRWKLLEQLKNCDFNIPNPTKKTAS